MGSEVTGVTMGTSQGGGEGQWLFPEETAALRARGGAEGWGATETWRKGSLEGTLRGLFARPTCSWGPAGRRVAWPGPVLGLRTPGGVPWPSVS